MNLFNKLEDPLQSSSTKNRPKKDMSIADEYERKMHWELDSKEWRKKKVSLEQMMKKYIWEFGDSVPKHCRIE